MTMKDGVGVWAALLAQGGTGVVIPTDATSPSKEDHQDSSQPSGNEAQDFHTY